jgi:hypothetical protein
VAQVLFVIISSGTMRAVWRFIPLHLLPGYLLDDQTDRLLIEPVPPLESGKPKESGFLNNLSN